MTSKIMALVEPVIKAKGSAKNQGSLLITPYNRSSHDKFKNDEHGTATFC